jgi:hypothetical protein
MNTVTVTAALTGRMCARREIAELEYDVVMPSTRNKSCLHENYD